MDYRKTISVLQKKGYFGPVGGFCPPMFSKIGDPITSFSELQHEVKKKHVVVLQAHMKIADPRTKQQLHYFIQPWQVMNMKYESVCGWMEQGRLKRYNN